MSPSRAIVVGTGATIVTSLPMFLVGALAVQLTTELAFGTAALGLVIAAFRATTAGSTLFLGRLVDRVGSTGSLRLSAIVALATCVGIAAIVTSWAGLVAWMVVGGTGVALAQPAANRLIVDAVPTERRGVAFGVKQAALPGATLLAGLSVPLIAVTIGWRYAYWIVAILAAAVLLSMGARSRTAHDSDRSSKRPPRISDRRTLVVFAMAFGIGNFANSVIPAFYVVAAVRAGTPTQLAGALLAVASASAIGVRLVSGIACDRMTSGHVRLCAAMLAAGAGGLALLAIPQSAIMAVGAVVGLAGAWGLNAVFWFALMRAYPETPGTVTGLVAPAGHVGSTLGPVVFGVIAETVSYAAAWMLGSVMAVVAATVMNVASRRLERGGATT